MYIYTISELLYCIIIITFQHVANKSMKLALYVYALTYDQTNQRQCTLNCQMVFRVLSLLLRADRWRYRSKL